MKARSPALPGSRRDRGMPSFCSCCKASLVLRLLGLGNEATKFLEGEIHSGFATKERATTGLQISNQPDPGRQHPSYWRLLVWKREGQALGPTVPGVSHRNTLPSPSLPTSTWSASCKALRDFPSPEEGFQILCPEKEILPQWALPYFSLQKFTPSFSPSLSGLGFSPTHRPTLVFISLSWKRGSPRGGRMFPLPI